MTTETLANNWALIIAAAPALLALILILRSWAGRTAGGQLRVVLGDYRNAQQALNDARQVSLKTTARVEKLRSKAGKTVPRTLQEAREANEDAQSLEKIARDRVLVAANHVRRVIHEEYPPVSQAKLRNKYLPQDNDDTHL